MLLLLIYIIYYTIIETVLVQYCNRLLRRRPPDMYQTISGSRIERFYRRLSEKKIKTNTIFRIRRLIHLTLL